MRAALLALSLLLAGPLAAQQPAPTTQDTVRASIASARTDLRLLVVAQEAYFADRGRYSTSLDSLSFTPARGSSVAFIVTRNDGWSASVKHTRLTGNCIVFVNLPEADRPKTAGAGLTTEEGVPRCDEQPELAQTRARP